MYVLTELGKADGTVMAFNKYACYHCTCMSVIRVSTDTYLGSICYDDGCHLKKYAMNPSRRELTSTTKVLSELWTKCTWQAMWMLGASKPVTQLYIQSYRK